MDLIDIRIAEGSLRERAQRADAEGTRSFDHATLWFQLVAGELHVADSYWTPVRSFLILERRKAGHVSLSPRSLRALECSLAGVAQKVVADELQLSISSVATITRQALTAIGVLALPSRAPVLLSLLAHGARNPSTTGLLRRSAIQLTRADYVVLSTPLRHPGWDSVLSPAERAVVYLRAEGCSHAEIARSRRTSPRTIANQLGAAFRRLGVSGRGGLLQYLVLPAPSEAWPHDTAPLQDWPSLSGARGDAASRGAASRPQRAVGGAVSERDHSCAATAVG
jgi:DNA-binding CsgD family transcriptional regulator